MAESRGGVAGAGSGTVSVAAVEELIRSLPGVLHARLRVNDWGGVEEIHVLADSARHPKSVVRDVESGLAARWGLIVDHKRISVAQMVNVPPRPKWVRVRIQRLAVTTDPVHGQCEVEVTLAPDRPRDIFGRLVHDPEIPDEEWQGRARGSNAGDLGLRLAAAATVEALNRSLIPGHAYALEEAARAALGGRDLVICLVHYRGPRGKVEVVPGSALLRGEPMEAAVRAVLSATNRLHGIAMRRQYQHRTPGGAWDNPDMPEWARDAAAAAEEEEAAERAGAEGGAGAGDGGRGPARGPREEAADPDPEAPDPDAGPEA
jgi:hypothetical protein